MSDKLRKTLVYASLPLALLWAVYNFNERRQRTTQDAGHHASQVQGEQVKATAGIIPDLSGFKKQPWGSDPFRCYLAAGDPSQTAPTRARWTLSGIVYSETQPMAFVNGQAVSIGDVVKGATVLSISREVVTLDFDGKRVVLKVNKG